jgi:alpha-mannosidase
VVTVRREFSSSSLEQVITLAPGSRTVEVAMQTDWHEAEKFLKVAFPLDVRAENVAAETQFGFHKRVTHTNTSWEAAKFETSMHRWVLAEEPGFGVGLVNDSVYGYDVTREVSDDGVAPAPGAPEVTTTVRLSLLRAPRFPDPETDQGVQTHRYGLVIGADTSVATEAGATFGARPRELRGATGVEPLVSVSGGVTPSAVKLADDRSGDLVVRVYEALGRRASGTVTVATPVAGARTVSLIEDDVDGGGADVTADGGVVVELNPFEVRTLRFVLA